MARREKHRRAERFKRGGFILDEAYPVDPPAERAPRGGYEPGELEGMILGGLQHKPTYQGTVDPVIVAGRRAANKRARRARRAARIAA